jgi:NAD(P)-dependent dehydrogenase (short-subunit alcohol dehydrogenase family)
MKGLKDKVVVVTGGASGLGKATAQCFSDEGAKVVVADINEEMGKKVAAGLQQGHFVKVNVADHESVKNMIDEAVSKYGRIDVLFNNAGIDGEQAPTHENSIENWKKVTSIDLDGVFYGMKYSLEKMKAQGNGVIINTSSTAGLVGFENIPPYSASKAGVIQLTKAAAIEYAGMGIRVNAICPSVVKTALVENFIKNSDDPKATEEQFNSLNPMPGWVQPEDVANTVVFLASDEARFITGVALPIDGGYTAQ